MRLQSTAEKVVTDQSTFSDPSNWIAAGIVIAVGILVAFGVRAAIRRVAKRTDTVTSTVQVMSQVVMVVLVLVTISIALRTLGVDLTPVLAGAGILGIVLGFALKDVAENYVAGILMGFNNPFSPGDQVIVDDGQLEGTIEELQLRYTVIRSSDGIRILVPNSILLKNPIQNLTANGTRRSWFTVGVAFGSDIGEVRRIVQDTLTSIESVLRNPPPEVVVEELSDAWMTLRIRFWHGPTNRDHWHTRGDAIEAVFSALDAAGIDMPFPRQVVELAAAANGGAEPSGEPTEEDG